MRLPLLDGGGLGTPGTQVLNDLGATGIWSMSRYLTRSYSGALYSLTSSKVSAIRDQSGNGYDLTDAGQSTLRPTDAQAGPYGRECAGFDGSNNYLVTSIGSYTRFIANNAGWIVCSCIIDSFISNTTLIYANDRIVGDQQESFALIGRNTGGGTIYADNSQGSQDASAGNIPTGVPIVLSWRHEGGVLYLGVFGTSPLLQFYNLFGSSITSGNTQADNSSNTFNIGGRGNSFFNGKIFELATFNVVPDQPTRTKVVTDFAGWVGAALGGRSFLTSWWYYLRAVAA